MIHLTINLSDITQVLQVFDKVEIMKYIPDSGIPESPVVSLVDYAPVSSGIDEISNRYNVSDIVLMSQYSQYYFTDPHGNADNWYISRYSSTSTGATSGWADPILGEAGDLFYNPFYGVEVEYGTSDQNVIDRIRLLIGDPIGLNREYGEAAESSIHGDGKTYQMDETGWPCLINMNGVTYNETTNPTVNGYKFLRFNDFIDMPVTVTSGGRTYQEGINVYYYTFRFSDRQIMEAYNLTPVPPSLTISNATSEVYMLACAYDLLTSETWEVINEDGAIIKDDRTAYNPSPGMELRDEMLDKLKKRLDDLIKSLMMTGITGVLID